MRWLEYLLPLIFLTPLFATAVVVLGLRHLFQDQPGFATSGQRLRQSGHRFRERLADARRQLFLAGALGPVVAITPLIYGMGRMLFSSHQDWIEWSIYGLITTILALIVGAFMMALSYRISRLRLRLACAMSVAHDLERLMRAQHQPLHVFHDVPADNFTIDHVIVTDHGVFSLMVKARSSLPVTGENHNRVLTIDGERLRFPDHEESRPLREARRARRWLHIHLSRTCRQEIPVQGLLMIPGWHLEMARPNEDISVLSDDALMPWLQDHATTTLSETLHASIVAQLTRLTEDQRMHNPLAEGTVRPV